jgi:putative oxidoreductase
MQNIIDTPIDAGIETRADHHIAKASASSRVDRLAPHALAALRIVAAFMFLQSGTMKLFAWPMGMPPDNSTADLLTQTGIGGMLEVVGGTLMLIGLFTRPTAFVLSGMMAVAYFQFHQPEALWPMMNGGTAAVLYCFLWLYFAAAGPGKWSVDGVRAR